MLAVEKRTISMAAKQAAYSDAPAAKEARASTSEVVRVGLLPYRSVTLQSDAGDEVALIYDVNAGPPIARRPARPSFQTLHSYHGKG